MCTRVFKFHDIKFQWVSPKNVLSSMFQDPIKLSCYNLKIYPWNLIFNVTQMLSKQPFHRLGNLGVNFTKVDH